MSLNNLAALYNNQGQYAEAKPLYERALAIREKALGPDYRATLENINCLAMFLQARESNATEPVSQPR